MMMMSGSRAGANLDSRSGVQLCLSFSGTGLAVPQLQWCGLGYCHIAATSFDQTSMRHSFSPCFPLLPHSYIVQPDRLFHCKIKNWYICTTVQLTVRKWVLKAVQFESNYSRLFRLALKYSRELFTKNIDHLMQ